jgi:CRISPR-associated protein Cmr1
VKTLEVKLRTVTPLFMGGANPAEPELRAPEFKSLMRWWYRAIDPGFGTVDPDHRCRRESRIFGDAAGPDDGASAFSIRLVGWQSPHDPWPPGRRLVGDTPLRDYARGINPKTDGDLPYNGITYLGYGLDGSKKERKPPRAAIRPGVEFTLKLTATSSMDETGRKAVLASLWALINLGGAGSRCRRGFGALEAVSWPEDWDAHNRLPAVFSGKTLQEWIDFVSESLKTIRSWFPCTWTPEPRHTVLGTGTRVYVYKEGLKDAVDGQGQGRDGWAWALNKAGIDLQKHRRRMGVGSRGDYDRALSWLQNGIEPLGEIKRVAFGLPLAFRSRSVEDRELTLRGDYPSDASAQGRDKRTPHDRSASRLFIRVTRIGEFWHPTVVLLRGPLLAPGEQLSRGATDPGMAPLEDFCDNLVVDRKAVKLELQP